MPDNTPTSTLKALARLGADFSATDREDHIAAVLADTVSAMVAANSCTVALGPPDDLTVAARGPDDGKDSLEDIEELIRSEAIRADPPRSVGLPLAAGSRTYGAIAVRRDAPFTVEELAALNTASALAAVALRNAELVRLLATRRQEWEQTANAVPQALCLIDERGIVQRGNAAFADLVGLSLTAIQQREWIELVPESWIDPIGRIVAAPERNETTELSDSGRVYAATAIPAGAGEDSATILTFDDLTDRRELQNQLAQSAKMSSLGQLVSGIAHDLNNPLTSVIGFADYLTNEAANVPEQLKRPLSAMHQEAVRAASIVRNLLSFARQQEPERAPVAMKEVVEDTVSLMQNQLAGYQLECVVEIEEDLPLVEADFNQLRQVLVNLINNAAQSLAELDAGQGVVRIVLGHSANGVSLAVADNGPGLSQDDLDRIFDPFYTTKGESGGTGLGLSIARGIVEEHGGRITVTAELGAGAKFTVELPEYRGKSEHSGRAKAIVLDDDATLDVLVVDDEPHILHYMRATLEAWGHSVRVAESGGAALERISEREPDIVITDIRMPELSGRSLYDEIVRRNKALSHRVIFSTGDTMRDDTLKFLESLERPYLRKPFTLNRLKSVLAQVAEA